MYEAQLQLMVGYVYEFDTLTEIKAQTEHIQFLK